MFELTLVSYWQALHQDKGTIVHKIVAPFCPSTTGQQEDHHATAISVDYERYPRRRLREASTHVRS